MILSQLAVDGDDPTLLQLVDEQQPLGGEEPSLGYLRGAAIRVAAVRLLARSESSGVAIHHSRWYELLREAGYAVGGQDPQAAFLTQIHRSPVVDRTAQPGTYRLDFNAPARLRDHLQALHHELAQLHAGQETLEGFTSTRERRAELTSEYEKVERELTEAIETLMLPTEEREAE